MLIIAIGFGGDFCDPFTCAYKATSQDIDLDNAEEVIAFIMKAQNLVREQLDEIFVIHNDNVKHHYTVCPPEEQE